MTYEKHGKRAMDITLSGLGLLVSAPVILALAGAVVIDSGRPILFVQKRIGQKGKVFRLLKFRSMAVDTPNVQSSEIGVSDVTRVGRVIRRLNLDELPQLINVVRGEMSLVGPRPALPCQEDLLELRRGGGAKRLKPGLTGLAQVNSYDGMSASAKAEYDNQYAKDVSLLKDLKIFRKTVTYLLSPPPVY